MLKTCEGCGEKIRFWQKTRKTIKRNKYYYVPYREIEFGKYRKYLQFHEKCWKATWRCIEEYSDRKNYKVRELQSNIEELKNLLVRQRKLTNKCRKKILQLKKRESTQAEKWEGWMDDLRESK